MKKSAKKLYNEYLPARLLMDCMDGNWDSWRDNYTRLTLTELSWFHVGLHNFVGVQSHYDFRRIKEVLDKIITDEIVLRECRHVDAKLAARQLERLGRHVG